MGLNAQEWAEVKDIIYKLANEVLPVPERYNLEDTLLKIYLYQKIFDPFILNLNSYLEENGYDIHSIGRRFIYGYFTIEISFDTYYYSNTLFKTLHKLIGNIPCEIYSKNTNERNYTSLVDITIDKSYMSNMETKITDMLSDTLKRLDILPKDEKKKKKYLETISQYIV